MSKKLGEKWISRKVATRAKFLNGSHQFSYFPTYIKSYKYSDFAKKEDLFLQISGEGYEKNYDKNLKSRECILYYKNNFTEVIIQKSQLWSSLLTYYLYRVLTEIKKAHVS